MTNWTSDFKSHLATLPSIEHIVKLNLYDHNQQLVATIENKPGQSGSVAVYHYLFNQHKQINQVAAREGLDLYAEHTTDAKQNLGKHPNIDRLLQIAGGLADGLMVEVITH